MCFVARFRYYGVRKPNNNKAALAAAASTQQQTSMAVAATQHPMHGAAAKKHMVAKPIITVTEFTPGNTPDRVGDL